MNKKEQMYLDVRLEYNSAEGETVFRHYVKDRRGYMLHLFTCLDFWKTVGALAIGVGFVAAAHWFADSILFTCAAYFAFLVCSISFFGYCIRGIWFYRYDKHIVVTDRGIWIASLSMFWWNKAFDGKKHLCSASWSFYEYAECSSVYPDGSPSSRDLQDFCIDRWDGTQRVRGLKKEEVAELTGYARSRIVPKQKRKVDNARKRLSRSTAKTPSVKPFPDNRISPDEDNQKIEETVGTETEQPTPEEEPKPIKRKWY